MYLLFQNKLDLFAYLSKLSTKSQNLTILSQGKKSYMLYRDSHFVSGSITVQLTSSLTGLKSANQVNFLFDFMEGPKFHRQLHSRVID